MKKVTFITFLLISLSASASSLKSRVKDLESKVSKIQKIIGNQKTYVGSSLVQLDKFVENEGLSLEVLSTVSANLVKKHHAILQSCFVSIKSDFPDASLSFTRIKLSGHAFHKTSISNGNLRLYFNSSAQDCYNTIYSEGLNR